MKTAILTILVIAMCAATHAQKKPSQGPTQQQQTDEEILRVVSRARDQVDNFTEVMAVGALKERMEKREVDVARSAKLLREIELDTKNEKRWEKTVWGIPNSEVLPGEEMAHFGIEIMVSGTPETCRKRFPNLRTPDGLPVNCTGASDPDIKLAYFIKAPLEVKAHILMEGLRHGISHWIAVQEILGYADTPGDDAIVNAWNSAWFDARNIYCRRSPGTKYFDLTGEEQICREQALNSR